MSIKKGSTAIVDRYKGSQLIERVYKGTDLIFDAYTTVTGSLPLTFNSRAEHALKDYSVYGTASGSGVETENLFDKNNLNIVKAFINSNDTIADYGTNGLIYIPVVAGNTYTFLGFKRASSATDIRWGITSSIPANNVPCTRVGFLNQSSSVTVTITSGEAYLCIFLCGDSDYIQYGSVEQAIMDNAETGMIVQGSTAPTTYIPYGYKIPILNTSGVTENLFDGDIYLVMTNTVETDQRYGISITTPGTYTIKTYGTTNSYLYAATFTTENVQIEKKNIVVNGTTSTGTFTITQGQRLSLYSAIGESKSAAEEKFNNWKPVIVKGSTAPSEYTPHRYTSNYDLFIGDSKLGEEEYVDYGEQKVYRVSADLWDVNGTTTNQSGVPRPGNEFETLGTYVIENNSSVTIYYREGVETITVEQGSITSGNSFEISTTDTLVIWLTSQSEMSYITVYRKNIPTDPPAPLPAISAYKGENALSSTETVGTVTVKGRISEVTPTP